MRINFVLPIADMSGGNKVVTIYAKLLSNLGHEVLLVSPPPKKPSIIYKLKSFLKRQGWPKNKIPKSFLYNSELNYKILDRYRPVTDKDLPDGDVVIATWWETAEWVNKLNKSKGAKVYFIQHHEVFNYLPVKRSSSTYRLPLHKIVIARWLVDIMKYTYFDTSVDLVPNGVDINQFFAAARNKQYIPTIGFLFSHAEFKGVDISLKVIKKVKEILPNLRILSFGSSLPIEYPHWIKEIEFYHSPEQNKIREIYAQCDVWLTASKSEGFNLPVMEAMACRTPIVSTKTGWPIESITDGYNGYLVNIDDVDAMVSSVLLILTSSNQEWLNFSNNAFNTIENSTWENSVKLLEQALSRAVEANTLI